MASDPPRNPFATKQIRPGAVPYFFPPGMSLELLIERLEQQHWRGEIIGPHGTGKSTLLAALKAPLQARGKRLVEFTFRHGERRLPSLLGEWDKQTLVVVDGAEQLSWFSRWRLRRRCGRAAAGLLWTAHQPLGLSVVWETQGDPILAQQLVEHLLGEARGVISPAEVEASLRATHGDVREMLFRLYDVFQRRQREKDSD